jgi:hypothetical protein
MPRNKNPHDFLPHDILGRIALGLLSATYLPASVLCLYGSWSAPPAFTWGLWLMRAGVWEFFVALFAVSVGGLIWAVAAPNWLLPFANFWVPRLALLTLLPFIILAAMLIWPA